jgi:hypothetical protein
MGKINVNVRNVSDVEEGKEHTEPCTKSRDFELLQLKTTLPA